MSEVPSSNELLEQIKPEDQQQCFKLGVVSALFENGTAQVTFDGEDSASQKQYAYLDSYSPKLGDRVLLASISNNYVILGKVNYNVSPSGSVISEGKFTTINSTGLALLNSIDVSNSARFRGNVTFDNYLALSSLKVNGSIGFFGGSLASKINVNNVPYITTNQYPDSTYSYNEQTLLGQLKTDVTNLRNSLNEVITALKQYNLI
jgi:hypothetical protein